MFIVATLSLVQFWHHKEIKKKNSLYHIENKEFIDDLENFKQQLLIHHDELNDSLKSNNYQIVATSLDDNSIPIDQIPLNHKLALCFGTEIDGLTKEIHKQADILARIPMFGFTQSFNVSVSVSLCLYELSNKLRANHQDWEMSAIERQYLRFSWVKESLRDGEALIRKYFEGKT